MRRRISSPRVLERIDGLETDQSLRDLRTTGRPLRGIRIAGAVVLACLGWTGTAPAQDEAPDAAAARPPSPASAATPARDPAPPARGRRAARRRPIHDSMDRVIDSVVDAHMQPCGAAKQQGVPCFPVSVEQEGPRFSVAEALRRYRVDGRALPGAPTVSEIQHQMSGAPQSASGGVGFDPVCTAKNLVKKLSGRNTTFFLYRMWDERGERPLLTDRKLDPSAYAANLAVRYEYMGEFDGECAAVAAWRQALREAVEPKPTPNEGATRDEPPQ